MILIFIMTILLLFITIARLCFDFSKQKKTFENRIDVLEGIITTLQEKQLVQQKQLKLSDALFNQLKKSNSVLSETVLDLNVNLLEELFNKKK